MGGDMDDLFQSYQSSRTSPGKALLFKQYFKKVKNVALLFQENQKRNFF